MSQRSTPCGDELGRTSEAIRQKYGLLKIENKSTNDVDIWLLVGLAFYRCITCIYSLMDYEVGHNDPFCGHYGTNAGT